MILSFGHTEGTTLHREKAGSSMQRSWTPQFTWQDSLHQTKRQCKELYPLCFSSKPLSNNQAGHHSQFAKQGETLDPTSQFFVQHSWRQPVQKQPCRKGSSRWSVMLQLFVHHPLNQSQGRAAGLERWEVLSTTAPHIHHHTLHCTKLETWASLSSRNLSNLQLGSWAFGRKFTGLGCSHTHTHRQKMSPTIVQIKRFQPLERPVPLGVWPQGWTLLGKSCLPTKAKSWCPNCPVCRKEKCPAPGMRQQEGTVSDSWWRASASSGGRVEGKQQHWHFPCSHTQQHSTRLQQGLPLPFTA